MASDKEDADNKARIMKQRPAHYFTPVVHSFIVGLKDCMAIENNATEKNEGLVSKARPSGSATQNPRQKKLCNQIINLVLA
jgi:hypothetical protein